VTDPRDARWSMSVDSGNKTAECIDFGNLVLIILRRSYSTQPNVSRLQGRSAGVARRRSGCACLSPRLALVRSGGGVACQPLTLSETRH